MNKRKLVMLISVILITAFNYVGCGGGGGSGSSTPPSSTAPLLTTNPATNITYNSARLHGTADPNGVSTDAFFQYGGSTSYGTNTSYQNIGSGNVAVNVSEDITGLSSNTQYNFRIRAIRTDGTFNGLNQTFTTLKPSPTCTTNPATDITHNLAKLNGTVNPNGLATNTYFEYGITYTPPSYTITTTAYAIGSGSNNIPVYVDITGLSSNTEYNFKVFGTNSTGTSYGNNLIFTTGNSPGSPPTCITDPANNVITNSARLNGTVNPNGVVTDAYFEYGISTNPYPISTTLQPIGNGITSVALSATVSSLTPNTLYNFRVIGTNGSITTTHGNNLTFTTAPLPPTCTTNVATNVTYNFATLNGTVNPNGGNVTSCWFDYGTSLSYGISATVVSLPGSGTSPISVTANVVSPLSVSILYNFRVVATNAGGTTNGNNQTFTTTTAPTTAIDDYCWVVNYGSGSGNSVTRILKSNPAITTTIAVGSGPMGVAVDETYCWVANWNSVNVTRITKSTLATTNITVRSSPEGVAVDETYCWVTNNAYNNVTRIVKSTLATTNITVGTGPQGVAVDETYCWVANWSSGSAGTTVTRILKSDLSTTNITVEAQLSFGVAVAVDKTYCWVANYISSSGAVTRILKSNPAISTTITVGSGPNGVAVDEIYVWVANALSNNVTRILKSDLSTTNITVGTNPRGVAVDETYCWVANRGSNTVDRILKSDSNKTTIAVGTGPFSLGDMTGFAYDNYSRVP